MNNRYRPELPRLAALLGAVALTAAVLAGIHVEARGEAAPAIDAEFTGEVTAQGPVYRLPAIEVQARAGFFLAQPGHGGRPGAARRS